MNQMFYSCNSLKRLNLTHFNTSFVKDIGEMFFDCNTIKSLDLSSFFTPSLENMNMTFESVDKKYSSFEGGTSNFQSSLKKYKNDFEKEIPEISISISSESSSSLNNSVSFYKNSLSISSQINLTFLSKYKNLDQFTLGEFSKNRNLRMETQKFIQYYLSKIHELKEEKLLEPLITKKSINSLIGDYSTSPHYTMEKKYKKIMSKDSHTKRSSKRISTDLKIPINIDEPKNSLCFIRKNKIPNYDKLNTLKRYIIIKTNSSYDSVKRRSSNAVKNINISACSSFRKEKIEINKINKIKTKNEYEHEIVFNENSEKKSSHLDTLKIKVECKELNFQK
jgi:surface protein